MSQQALSATCRPLGCSVDLCVPLAGLTQEEYICTGSHAQRLVAAATALLLDGDFKGVGSACRKPPEFSWQAHVARLTAAEFKQRYRLAPQSFDKLLSILEPDLSVQNEKQHLNSRFGDRPIELPVRLAVALRYFAGGDPLDLKLIYCISKQTVYSCCWSDSHGTNTDGTGT